MSKEVTYNAGDYDYLQQMFGHNDQMMSIINGIGKRTLRFSCLARLCQGFTITTVGYRVNATHHVSRCPAVIHDLRKLGIPISSYPSPNEKGTDCFVFFIAPEDLASLRSTNPVEVSRVIYEQLERVKKDKEDRDAAKIEGFCKLYGPEFVISLVEPFK